MAQSMIRTAQQMTYLGYYGDARVAERCGYVPFSKRRYDAAAHVERDRPRVQCLTPREIDRDTLSADVVIAGSGAAGATLAYELARLGRSVLVLERGRHVDPSQFSEDEAKQFSALYEDGALTLSRDFRFQVAQGSCVGGSTVVNNGVCFDLPQRVLARWNDPGGLDAGIDEQRLRASFAHLRDRPRRTAGVLRRRRRQHRRLPRLRLLQHRLCLRQEAVDARQHAAARTTGVRRPRTRARRVPRRADHRGWAPRERSRLHALGWPPVDDQRQDRRRQRRRDRLEPAAAA
jgi:choline dehydrogenase-like flavoprotein